MPIMSMEHRYPVITVAMTQHCSSATGDGDLLPDSGDSVLPTNTFHPTTYTPTRNESFSPLPSSSSRGASSVSSFAPIGAQEEDDRGRSNSCAIPNESRTAAKPILHHDTHMDAATTTTTTAGTMTLSKEIQNILIEVARTGTCRSLAWSQGYSRHHVHDTKDTLENTTTATATTTTTTAGTDSVHHNTSIHRKRSRIEIAVNHSTHSATSMMDSYSSSNNIKTKRASTSGIDTDYHHSSSEQKDKTLDPQTTLNIHSIFHNLQDIFLRVMSHVLDDFYFHRGGYRISSVEQRKIQSQLSTIPSSSSNTATSLSSICTTSLQELEQRIFLQRRERLLLLLGGGGKESIDPSDHGSASVQPTIQPSSSTTPTNIEKDIHKIQNNSMIHPNIGNDGPPFTIQRIAEILLTPDKYYQQTHKLCNALEKLLLVTSSTKSFGGVSGGDTTQNTREVQELVALADERGREVLEQRDRRLKQKRRNISFSEEMESFPNEDYSPRFMNHKNYFTQGPMNNNNNNNHDSILSDMKWENDATNVSMETAIYSSPTQSPRLNHHTSSPYVSKLLDTNTLSSSTNNPPKDADRKSYCTHSTQDLNTSSSSRTMGPLSTIDYTDTNTPSCNFVQSSTYDGINVSRPQSPSFLAASLPYETHRSNDTISPTNHLETAIRPVVSSIDPKTESKQEGKVEIIMEQVVDPYGDLGRSSASYSDIDSESGDDISLDDSASDKSDGSEGMMASTSNGQYMMYNNAWGTGGTNSTTWMNTLGGGNTMTSYTNNITNQGMDPSPQSYSSSTARIMAWNRMQQQQRRSLNPSQPYSPLGLSDSEYQSGDSIDSMMAEDSEGSESSSSDA